MGEAFSQKTFLRNILNTRTKSGLDTFVKFFGPYQKPDGYDFIVLEGFKYFATTSCLLVWGYRKLDCKTFSFQHFVELFSSFNFGAQRERILGSLREQSMGGYLTFRVQ